MSMQKSATEGPETALCHHCHKFYGTQTTDWLCSACFKQETALFRKGKKEQKVELAAEPSKEEPLLLQVEKKEKVEEEKPEQLQKDRKRCYACQKKVGLLGVECKCSFVYCNAHRLPEDHKCGFDFKTKGLKELSKAVVKVDHEKIVPI